jgi:hypothetical protein
VSTNSFALKLGRAREHLSSFEEEAKRWIEGKPYGIVDERDPDPPPQAITAEYVPRRFRIDRVSDIPSRLSLLVGDCLFNLRSALDHLALALARSFTSSMTERQVADSEFPIFRDGANYPQAERKKIGCVNPDARTVIETMQPYQKAADYSSDPLWQLHELNRIDKHRTLTVCAAVPLKAGRRAVGFRRGGDHNLAGTGYVTASGNFGLILNAVPLRWAALPADPDRGVIVQPLLPLEIVFGDGSPVDGQVVIPTVRAMCDHVGNVVIPTLSPFL